MKIRSLLIGLLISLTALGSYTVISSKNARADIKIEYVEDSRIMELQEAGIDLEVYVSDELLCDSVKGRYEGEVIVYNDGTEDGNFIVEEFLEFDKDPSGRTACLIKTKHIPELEKVRVEIGKPIIIRSGSRSFAWEINRGRSGLGQHVYLNGFGAVDISTQDATAMDLHNIVKALALKTDYSRIARYSSFVHADFAQPRIGERAYYKNADAGWIYQGKIKPRL